MRTCNSCGGIIGRDCFNPMECAMITQSMEREEERRIEAALSNQVDDHYNLEYLNYKFHKLMEYLELQGIDLSGYKKEIEAGLPF